MACQLFALSIFRNSSMWRESQGARSLPYTGGACADSDWTAVHKPDSQESLTNPWIPDFQPRDMTKSSCCVSPSLWYFVRAMDKCGWPHNSQTFCNLNIIFLFPAQAFSVASYSLSNNPQCLFCSANLSSVICIFLTAPLSMPPVSSLRDLTDACPL